MKKIKILVGMIRRKKGMSIRTLSQRSGISRTEISRIECGDVSPTMDTLFQLADALGVDIKETFDTVREERKYD